MHENDGALDMCPSVASGVFGNVSYERGCVHDLSTFATRFEIDSESCGAIMRTLANAIAEAQK